MSNDQLPKDFKTLSGAHTRDRGFSQAFYRVELYKELGFEDLESFMKGFWETWACSKGNQTLTGVDQILTAIFADPENMLLMLQTWQDGDCSKQEPYNGDFVKAMQAITAKMLVLPGATDLYFP